MKPAIHTFPTITYFGSLMTNFTNIKKTKNWRCRQKSQLSDLWSLHISLTLRLVLAFYKTIFAFVYWYRSKRVESPRYHNEDCCCYLVCVVNSILRLVRTPREGMTEFNELVEMAIAFVSRYALCPRLGDSYSTDIHISHVVGMSSHSKVRYSFLSSQVQIRCTHFGRFGQATAMFYGCTLRSCLWLKFLLLMD